MSVQTITFNDKSNLNVNSQVPDINKINDTDMNEIKSVVNNNAYELIDTKGAILWANSNQSADFGTAQITLSSDDYDILEWFFLGSPEDSNAIFSIRILKGYGGQVLIEGNGVFNGVNNNSFIVRNLTRVSDTQYNPSYAMYKYGTNSSYNVMNILKPIYVVGYKTGLF